MQEDSIYYDHQQLDRRLFWPLIILIDLLLMFVIISLLTGKAGIMTSGIASIMLLSASAAVIYLFFYLKLEVKIDFEFLYIFISRQTAVKIPVHEISFTEIASFKRFADYGGIGIGRTFKKIEPAYFLSASGGVRIYFPLSRKIIVGANDPKKLINAIVYAQQRKKILSEMN